jgi:hypothetical protein
MRSCTRGCNKIERFDSAKWKEVRSARNCFTRIESGDGEVERLSCLKVFVITAKEHCPERLTICPI